VDSKTIIGSAALFAGMALAPAAQAQIVVGIGVQTDLPVWLL